MKSTDVICTSYLHALNRRMNRASFPSWVEKSLFKFDHYKFNVLLLTNKYKIRCIVAVKHNVFRKNTHFCFLTKLLEVLPIEVKTLDTIIDGMSHLHCKN